MYYLRVVQRDAEGEIESSYYIIDKSTLNLNDKTNEVSANIEAGTLKLLNTTLGNHDLIIEEADLKGTIESHKGIGGMLSFALKGKNLVTESDSYTNEDNTFSSNTVEINTINGGALNFAELNIGTKEIQNFITLKAKGGENGKALRLSFIEDKNSGTYLLRADFKDGDEVKIKLFPFELKSKKSGDTASLSALVTPKGQNYQKHLEIMSQVANMQEVTSWLSINPTTISLHPSVTSKTDLEIFYSKEDLWDLPFNATSSNDVKAAATFGLGIRRKQDSGDINSYGVMLSGDSEIEVETNGRGVLRIAGIKQDRVTHIPTTFNFYWKKVKENGNSHMISTGYSATRPILNEEKFEDSKASSGLRGIGGGFIAVSSEFKLNDKGNIRAKFGAGIYEDFKEPQVSFCVEGKNVDFFSGLSNNVDPVIDRILEKQRKEYARKIANVEKTRLKILDSMIDELAFDKKSFLVILKVENKIKEILNQSPQDINELEEIVLNYKDAKKIFKLSSIDEDRFKFALSKLEGSEVFDEINLSEKLTGSSNINNKAIDILDFYQNQINRTKEIYGFKDLSEFQKRCNKIEKEFKKLSSRNPRNSCSS